MQLNNYERKFVRMMIKVGLMIGGIMVVMVIIKIPLKIRVITFGVLLVIAYLIKRVYWNYLERLELQEQIDKVIL